MSNAKLAKLERMLAERGLSVDELATQLDSLERREPDEDEDEEEDPESRWTDAEVAERWLESERRDPQGVLGIGGMEKGGIFGDGPVSTDTYDPSSRMRGEARLERRLNVSVQAQTLELLQELRRELTAERKERKRLQSAPRGALPPRRR